MSIAVGTKVRVISGNAASQGDPEQGTIGVIVEGTSLARDFIEEGESIANFPETGEQEFYVRTTTELAADLAFSILVEVIDA